MSWSRTDATVNLGLDAQYDRGTGMKLKVYAGAVPANAAASLGAAVLLGTLVLSNTPFAAAASRAKTANPITSDSDADATGTATFCRLTTSADVVIGQGTVSATGGGGDAILNATAIIQHTTISCSSLVITGGA